MSDSLKRSLDGLAVSQICRLALQSTGENASGSVQILYKSERIIYDTLRILTNSKST